jgi:hypothetical protein
MRTLLGWNSLSQIRVSITPVYITISSISHEFKLAVHFGFPTTGSAELDSVVRACRAGAGASTSVRSATLSGARNGGRGTYPTRSTSAS